jgi:hypothetical protein
MLTALVRKWLNTANSPVFNFQDSPFKRFESQDILFSEMYFSKQTLYVRHNDLQNQFPDINFRLPRYFIKSEDEGSLI